LILSSQTLDALKTTKGKDELRALLLEEVKKVVSENAELEGVENIYFTGYVMQ
jgi:flagellar basal body-associated protein FliL